MAVGTGFVEEEGEEINGRGRLNLFSFVEEDMIGELEKEKERKRREEEGEPEEDEDEDEEGGEGMDTEVEIKMKMKTATTDPKDMFDNFDKTKKSIFGKSSRTTKRLYKSYEKDYYEGPVTAVDTLVATCARPLLVIAAGSEIVIENLKAGELKQIGFFHANMHVLSITIIKNFILVVDAYDRMSFLVWSDVGKSLTLLGKDYDPKIVYAAVSERSERALRKTRILAMNQHPRNGYTHY